MKFITLEHALKLSSFDRLLLNKLPCSAVTNCVKYHFSPLHLENTGSEYSGRNEPEADYKKEAEKLRRYLKFSLFTAFKWKNGLCSCHLMHLFLFAVQFAKIVLITFQVSIFDMSFILKVFLNLKESV